MVPFFTSLTIAASSRQTSRFVDFLLKRRTRVGWIIAGSVDGIMVEIWSYHALFWLAIGMLGIAMICLLFIKDI